MDVQAIIIIKLCFNGGYYMKFEEVIINLATKNAIRRSANIGKDFRGQVEKEDLLAQKKLFLNEKRIRGEFCKYDENFDLRRLLLFLFLNKEDYSTNSDLKIVEKEIREFRKYLLENEKYVHWDKKEAEIYGAVLEAVLEDESVSPDELNVLEKLQKKLNIDIFKHWILRIKKDLFDEVNNAEKLPSEKLIGYLSELERMGLLFFIDKEGRRYVIPEEISNVLKKIFSMELQDYKYEELLNNTLITNKDKINFLKKSGIDVKGNSDKLNRTIIANRLKPSDFLNSLNTKSLYRISNKIAIKKSGSKEQKIKRIVGHYDHIYLPSIRPSDNRETYYKFYDELASRKQLELMQKGIIKKGEEIGLKFEEATRYLFEKKLGYRLQNPVIKGRKQGVKADGKAMIGNDYIIWDCKTKDKLFTMTTSERRQFVDYINEYNKADSHNFISFLIITPELKNPDGLRKQLTDIKSETGIDVSIIRASDLKKFAENNKKSSVEPTMKPFYHTRILDDNFLEKLI